MLTIDLKSLQLEGGHRVLDLGCGDGRHLHALFYSEHLTAVGIDLSVKDLLKAREFFDQYPVMGALDQRWYIAAADARHLPFPDASFDAIICSEVLEHILEYEEVVAEIDRILKPGGRLAISVPRFWPEWICWKLSEGYYNTPGGHVRIFKPKELRAQFEGRGFRLERRHWAHGLHSPYWWLQCALWEKRDQHWLIRQYHKFLVWDIMKRPLLTRMLEKVADPVMGKSIALYFRKPTKR